MDALGIKPGMTIADIGTGRGRLTLPLARHVRASGKVYANDIRADDLAFIQERCRREGLKNVEIVLGTPDLLTYPRNSLEFGTFFRHGCARRYVRFFSGSGSESVSESKENRIESDSDNDSDPNGA